MVKFELRQVGEVQQLIIRDGDKNTSHPIELALTGKHAHAPPTLDDIPYVQSSSWSFIQEGLPLLRSPLHNANTVSDHSFSTLGRRIISGEAKWGDTLKVHGKFRQPLKYSEWLEEILDRAGFSLRTAEIYDAVFASSFTYSQDSTMMRAFYEAWCTDTNSLHTSTGEVSITLWDLHVIGGLPTLGLIYDETIPYPDELDNDVRNDTLISQSCKFLLIAYHRLVGPDKKKTISPAAWVKYWFKGGLEHKSSRPQPLANSASHGANDSRYDWLPETKRVFVELGIPTTLFNEVYLAAFLSCWLCVFVLPVGSTTSIRATVFKPASLMASGKVLGLSFPVLAYIYKGLHVIAKSPTPGSSTACFPQHYLTTWMANYFGTHNRQKQLIAESRMSEFSGDRAAKSFSEEEARREIHSGKSTSWNATSFVKRYTQRFDATKRPLNDEERNRFVSIRPCLLSFRWKNAFYLQPYNPHRFSRQFGFSQRIPFESTKEDIRSSTLDEGMKHWALSQYEYPGTTVLIPGLPKSANEGTTSQFLKWWGKVHGRYLIEGRKLLIKSINGTSPPPVIVGTKRPGKSLTTLKEVLGQHDVPATKKAKTCYVSELEVDDVDVIGNTTIADLKDVGLCLLDEDVEMYGGNERVSFGSDDVHEATDLVNYSGSSGHAEEGSQHLQVDDASSSTPMVERSNKHNVSSSHPDSTSSASKYDDDILAFTRKFVLDLRKTLIRILEEYRTGDLCLLEEKSVKIIKMMESAGSIDASHLKSMVSEFFVKAREYNEQSSLFFEVSAIGVAIKDKNAQISVIVAKEESSKVVIDDFQKKIADIDTKMEQLKAVKEKIEASLVKEEGEIGSTQGRICSLESELSKLKAQCSKSNEAMNQRKKLSRALEHQFEKLKTSNLFP